LTDTPRSLPRPPLTVTFRCTLAGDAPEPRGVQGLEVGEVVEFPEVGGLHHRYESRDILERPSLYNPSSKAIEVTASPKAARGAVATPPCRDPLLFEV
jgi:hypothetical protein